MIDKVKQARVNKWTVLVGLTAVLAAAYVAFQVITMIITKPSEAGSIEPIDGILMVANFVLSIAAIGFVYSYLRRHRVLTEAAIATALVEATAATIATLAVVPLTKLFFDQDLPVSMLVLTLISTFITSLIFSYLVARIFKWRYDRKHSFAFEK